MSILVAYFSDFKAINPLFISFNHNFCIRTDKIYKIIFILIKIWNTQDLSFIQKQLEKGINLLP